MLAIMIIALFAGIVIIDYIPNRKNRKRKINVFYGIVLASSFCILLLYGLGVVLPSPTAAIEDIVKTIVPVK